MIAPTARALPDVCVVKLGGQSIMDRGAAAVLPLVAELAQCSKRHKIIVGTGGGTRSRHAYSIAMSLKMPTGIIAKLGGSVSRQNARMLAYLLAPHGGLHIEHEHFELLPLCMATKTIPVISGMPPYEFWERPPASGRIPDSRTDVGVLLSAEVLGARRLILVKDEDGLFTADPKKDPKARFIREISAQRLLKLDLPDLALERRAVELLTVTKSIRELRMINGLRKGELSRAIAGRAVGTRIFAE